MPRDQISSYLPDAAARAESIARAARTTARWLASEGRVSDFARGLIHGQLLAARCMFAVEPHIMQGLENEVHFILSRAAY